MADRREEPQGSADTVKLEFYSKDDGADQFAVELSREDFEHYQGVAENMGVPIEDLMLQLVEAQLYEQNTQWVLPAVDSEGEMSFEGATPVDLESLSDSSAKRGAGE